MKIMKILKTEVMKPYAPMVLRMCAKRIPHTVVYTHAIQQIVLAYKLPTIYTGQMYDRFALVEEEICKKYNKKLICIPHGIESTEEMPTPYVGDLFYCSSKYIASKLNYIYNTSKFVFDQDVTNKMYRIKKTVENRIGDKKVIFFTQPTKEDGPKKILKEIAGYLESKNRKLFIKVHPLENYSDYKINNTELIDDFEDAISNNICISLFSTVLVEATYNKSTPISIIYLLNNTEDLTGRFDFLNDERILKPIDKESLFKDIDFLTN
ncbi:MULTISPECIES: hypothetical protein [unclassified Mesobacillus]|uniref:hypothetical protein n=1 Tax=unclassified Mesobacillus TaxID=2675270 RepID=UPI00203AE91D|nr:MULTISPECIES: hypothetical protein [unclassified Mesobacillus]MCM3124167.1 hypothetical protein [Mesobacillus sp. MER 33]MCM3234016.1 hypothetical protein [Mesobacillus sp. MER 48]